MKILILNWRDWNNPKAGGAEIVTHEHAKYWVKSGHSVSWFSAFYPGAIVNEMVDGINIIRRGNYYTMYIYAFIYYIFSGRNYNLVIDEIHGIPFFTPLYVNKPKLAFIHEVAGEIWEFMYPFPINKLGRLIEKIMLMSYRKVPFMTVSESTRQELVHDGINNENITVITNGIKLKPLNILPKKEDKLTFIFISRIVKMKGIEDVIKAYSYLKKDFKESQLWVVGTGEDKYINKIKKMISNFGLTNDVIFYGYVTDDKKSELLRKAHLLIHASVKEGWGLVIIEAASQGTPSVVYKVPGLRDAVRNGETGIVVENNTAHDLAKSARNLFNNKTKYIKYQKNCLAWSKQFRWEKSKAESLRLIEAISKK